MQEIKIVVESGIALPLNTRRRKNNEMSYVFDNMQNGDSIFIPCTHGAEAVRVKQNLLTMSRKWRKNNKAEGYVFTAENVEGGIRIWKQNILEMGKYKIQKGPQPPPHYADYPLLKMEVGDSFFVPKGKDDELLDITNMIHGAIIWLKKKNGLRGSFKTKSNLTGVRVWKTK